MTEADAVDQMGNITKRAVIAPRAGAFWMESIARKGTVPWGDDPSYKVFRNVKDYGAKGDGVTVRLPVQQLTHDPTTHQTDIAPRTTRRLSTRPMTDGKRCGKKCNGSTTKNAIVYFPAGKYLVSTVIALPFST